MFFVIFSQNVFCHLQSCSLWCNFNNNIYTFFAILLFTVSNSQSLGGSQCTASAVADEDPQHGAL